MEIEIRDGRHPNVAAYACAPLSMASLPLQRLDVNGEKYRSTHCGARGPPFPLDRNLSWMS
jgi:hypothetical protein